MSELIRHLAVRTAAAALVTAALVVGLAVAPAVARTGGAGDGPTPNRAHAYVWKDGRLHVRPQVAPHHGEPRSSGDAPWHGGDARTQVVWSQWDEDFSGSHIMTARGDGRGIRSLTASTPGVFDIDPRLSSDGRAVLFERDGETTVEVMLIGVDGRGERVIDLGCADPCVADVGPTWGVDGRSVWFTRVIGPFNERGDAVSAVLWTADLSGRNVRRVTPAGVDPALEEYSAHFLPNGNRVYVQLRSADLHTWIMTVDGRGRGHQLTDESIDADTFDVSPAGHGPSAGLVVFETYGHNRPEGVASAVATVPSDCRTVTACMARLRYLTPTVLDETAPAENYNPAFSPDGSRIAYVHAFYGTDADPTFGADIWTMTWNGRDKRQFTSAAEWDYRPNWGVAARR